MEVSSQVKVHLDVLMGNISDWIWTKTLTVLIFV